MSAHAKIPQEFVRCFGPLTEEHSKAWEHMLRETPEHEDPFTGEINHTALAEDTADAFDLYEDDADYTIPEWVFDLALHAPALSWTRTGISQHGYD